MLTTYWLSSDLAALIWAALFIGFALHTIVSDFIYRRIPNLSLLVVLVCQSIWLIGEKLGVFPESTWGSSSALMLIGAFFFYLLVLFPLWMKGIIGGGDVKYMATLAYLIGLSQSFYLLLFGSLIIGIYALLITFLESIPLFYLRASAYRAKKLPYAGCIALAALIWAITKIF